MGDGRARSEIAQGLGQRLDIGEDGGCHGDRKRAGLRGAAAPRGVPTTREDEGSLPTEDAALVLLFSLVASGQMKLRKIDSGQKIGAVLNQHTAVAA